MSATVQSPYLKQYLKLRLKRHVVLALIAAILAGAWVMLSGVPTYEKITDKYDEVVATATGEGTTKVLQGTRRNKHWEEVRTVDVEYDLDGQKHSKVIRSNDVQVGEEVTVFVRESDGDALLNRPEGPGFWAWAFLIVGALIVLGTLYALVSGIRRTETVRSFTPEKAKGKFLADVRGSKDAVRNAKKKAKPSNLTRTISATVAAADFGTYKVGDSVNITGEGAASPRPDQIGHQLEGLVVKDGSITTLALVRTMGAVDWWVVEFNRPIDAVATSK